MRTRTILTLTIVTFGLQSCDSIPFIGGKSTTADSTTAPAAEPAPADAEQAPQTPAVEPLPDEPAPTPPAATPLSRSPDPLPGEMPWNPEHTGIVDPGMSAEQVIATWGEPAASRTQGAFTYLYFRNGCEISCGMFDLVILEGDQVVDAVVRGFGHSYSGVSSSPANTRPVPNATANTNGA